MKVIKNETCTIIIPNSKSWVFTMYKSTTEEAIIDFSFGVTVFKIKGNPLNIFIDFIFWSFALEVGKGHVPTIKEDGE